MFSSFRSRLAFSVYASFDDIKVTGARTVFACHGPSVPDNGQLADILRVFSDGSSGRWTRGPQLREKRGGACAFLDRMLGGWGQ